MTWIKERIEWLERENVTLYEVVVHGGDESFLFVDNLSWLHVDHPANPLRRFCVPGVPKPRVEVIIEPAVVLSVDPVVFITTKLML